MRKKHKNILLAAFLSRLVKNRVTFRLRFKKIIVLLTLILRRFLILLTILVIIVRGFTMFP